MENLAQPVRVIGKDFVFGISSALSCVTGSEQHTDTFLSRSCRVQLIGDASCSDLEHLCSVTISSSI